MTSASNVGPHRIALFANHAPGVAVASFLANSHDGDEICALYLTGESPANDQSIRDAAGIEDRRVFVGADVLKDPKHLHWLKEQQVNSIICVYWPWLLKEEVFQLADRTVNFHPALLPINRGWFPHVHSIIEGSVTGVTLHQIDKGADTGAIWAQRPVTVQPTDTAKDLYIRLQKEIVSLFEENWRDIKLDNLEPAPQDHEKATYHAKKEIEKLDKIELDGVYTGLELINKLRARSFGDKGFAYFDHDGEKIFLNLRLSSNSDF